MLVKPPQHERRLAAQGRARTAGQDGGRSALERGLGRSSDGVDTDIDAVERARSASIRDRVASQPRREQLPAGDVAVLEVNDLRDLLIYGGRQTERALPI